MLAKGFDWPRSVLVIQKSLIMPKVVRDCKAVFLSAVVNFHSKFIKERRGILQ